MSKVPEDTTEVEILTKELRSMINDKSYFERLSTNARSYAEKELDINIIAEKYKEFILEDKKTIITEDILKEIAINQVNKVNDKNIEIYKIAKTLCTIK